MKILLIIHDFLPRHMAGSEIYTYKLAKELSGRHDVALYFTEHRPECEQYSLNKGDYDGLQFFEATYNHSVNSFKETYLNSAMEKNFIAVLDDFKPDVIHIQHLLYHSLNYLKIAKDLNIPVVYTLHDYWLTCPDMRGGIRFTADETVCEDISYERCALCVEPRLNPPGNIEHRLYLLNRYLIPAVISRAEWFRKLGKWVIEKMRRENALAETETDVLADLIGERKKTVLELSGLVDVFIAPSKFLRKEHIQFGIDEKKIVYSDYGFDMKPFENIKRINSDVLRFAFIGTPSPHKGLSTLIMAFNSLPENITAELHVYGDLEVFSEYTKELKKLAQHRKIKFCGKFDNNTISDIYSKIDVLIVPSLWFENSPLTIHESFMAGIPVITSDFGGMRELVIDGRNGFLFERGNSGSLRKVIMKIIDNPKIMESLDFSIVPVKSIEEDSRWTEELYSSLARSDK